MFAGMAFSAKEFVDRVIEARGRMQERGISPIERVERLVELERRDEEYIVGSCVHVYRKGCCCGADRCE